jgi:transcriptional regulator with XRE-family HTH domain
MKTKTREKMEKIIKILQCRRIELKKTQAEIAESLGISQSFYSQIENGKRGFGIELLLDLIEKLDIDGNYLMSQSLAIGEKPKDKLL